MSKSVFVPNNNVYVSPEPESVSYLFNEYLKSAPFKSCKLEDLPCTIVHAGTSIDPAKLIGESSEYKAIICGAQIWLDPYLTTKRIVVILDSPELEARHEQILQLCGVKSLRTKFVPHITLAYDIPNSTRRNRWWVNQIINDFDTKYKGTILALSKEQIGSSYIMDQRSDVQEDMEVRTIPLNIFNEIKGK